MYEHAPKLKQNIAILFIFCVVIVFGVWFLSQEPPKLMIEKPVAVYSIPRHIQYGFTLQNTTNQVVKDAEFWAFAPVKQNATQQCNNIQSSQPHQLIVDPLGNQVLHYTFDVIPPYGAKIITISADLMLSKKANPSDIQDFGVYTKPEKFIESDHPKIVKLSKNLDAGDTVKTVRKYYAWIAENIQYTGYLAGAKGAEYATTHKKGDCTEFAYLLAALCRAQKIPARCIGGFICRENRILKPAEYHNWTEVYESGSWRHVDPQKKVFMENPSHYIAMRVIGNNDENPLGKFQRFRVEGKGLKVRMNY